MVRSDLLAQLERWLRFPNYKDIYARLGNEMKKVALLGSRGYIANTYLKNTDELLRSIGQNSGNLLFQKAVHDSILEETLLVGEDLSWDISETRRLCRVLVVPSANFVRENADFTSFVDFLERVDLPLVFLGLGAQADNFEKKSFDLHPSVVRLLDLCRERCLRIGVRGEFTQRVLSSYGVENTVVTGCPSNFLNKDPLLGEILNANWERPIESFMVVQDEAWPASLDKIAMERKGMNWCIDGAGVLVQQSVEPLIKYKRRENAYSGGGEPENFSEQWRQHMCPDVEIARFKSFLATRMRYYFAVDQWMEDCASFSFCTGLRLHGNMVAWQAGTPAVWVHHDSRTRELAEAMGLPNISIEEAIKASSVSDIRRSVELNLDDYFSKREVLQDRYNSILEVNSIKFDTAIKVRTSV